MELHLKAGTIVTKNGKVFLIKEKLDPALSYGWNICAGSWDAEDGDLIHAAAREAREEGGVEAEIQGVYKVALVNLGNKFKLQFFFVGTTDDEGVLPSKEQQQKYSEDIIEQKWFSKEEIMAMQDSEFVSSTIAKVVKEYVAAPTFTKDITIYFDKEKKF